MHLPKIKDYVLVRAIGSGSFGQIFEAQQVSTNKHVAIKIEKRNQEYPQLAFEAQLYAHLATNPAMKGISKIYSYFQEDRINVLAMELLGPSLEDLFSLCGYHFQLGTIYRMGKQMLERLQCLHEKRYIHRDVKPENFLIGVGETSRMIYLIDFGLSKQNRDETNKHALYRDDRNLTGRIQSQKLGTARYASITCHLGMEQSRRDDLEGLGYTLLYFRLGRLPWQRMQKKQAMNNKERSLEIVRRKLATPLTSLCNGDEILLNYMTYVRKLQFEDEPDYTYLLNIMTNGIIAMKVDEQGPFEWEDSQEQPSEMQLPVIQKKKADIPPARISPTPKAS